MALSDVCSWHDGEGEGRSGFQMGAVAETESALSRFEHGDG